MQQFKQNREKTIASLLFICKELGGAWDLYSLLKILYFAEQKHLIRYGRPITGDSIIAMEYGPVPSLAYDLLKENKRKNDIFNITGDNVVYCITEPNLDELSESDIKCLQESIIENKGLGFGAMKDKSHDASYEWAVNTLGKNAKIPFEEIARSAGASDEMIKYIRLNIENDALSLK